MSADMNMPQGVRSRGSSAGVISVGGGAGVGALCVEISFGTTGAPAGDIDGTTAAGATAAGAATEPAGTVAAGGTEGCGAGWPCPATEPHITARPMSPLWNMRGTEHTEPVMHTSRATMTGIVDHWNERSGGTVCIPPPPRPRPL